MKIYEHYDAVGKLINVGDNVLIPVKRSAAYKWIPLTLRIATVTGATRKHVKIDDRRYPQKGYYRPKDVVVIK